MGMTVLARRIEAGTPVERDRAVDALRAVAILGVVLGHWLVTALVATDGGVLVASPLSYLDGFAPVSWVFQTLAVFFLVGGRVAALGYRPGGDHGEWLTARLRRLFRPVLVLLAVWAVIVPVLLLAEDGRQTVHTVLRLAVSPLWFLLVFAGLTALTPLVRRLHPGWPLLTVLVVDVVRLGLDGPAALGWINLLAGWLVPYTLGLRWPDPWRYGRPLLTGGLVASVALVHWAGYPASMVGVPGGLSNLNPPTLAAVTFGLAQCGAALLLHGPLDRALRRGPGAWAAVALVNLSAMTVFLWHQTAMMAVAGLALLTAGPLPGLHTVPDTPAWIAARLLWLPVFAATLAACGLVFQRYETARSRPVPTRVGIERDL
jgi:peptidoglycan/LPS O-acetylase OafA/YrhL